MLCGFQKSIRQKLKYPGRFSLPCTIGKMENGKALFDLGASESLMPYSICKRQIFANLKILSKILELRIFHLDVIPFIKNVRNSIYNTFKISTNDRVIFFIQIFLMSVSFESIWESVT